MEIPVFLDVASAVLVFSIARRENISRVTNSNNSNNGVDNVK